MKTQEGKGGMQAVAACMQFVNTSASWRAADGSRPLINYHILYITVHPSYCCLSVMPAGFCPPAFCTRSLRTIISASAAALCSV